MLPSRRFLYLAAVGLIPAALSAFWPGLFAVSLLYFIGCCALLVGNHLWGVRPEEVVITRRVAARLSQGERERVTLHVANHSRRRIRVSLTDTVPPRWEAEGLPGELVVEPGQEASFAYQVTGHMRGRFEFGDLFARVEHSPWLSVRQMRIPAAQEVRIYPDLRAVTRYEVMLRRSRLSELGIHRSRMLGRGSEFERLRDYTPDDEYRHIDWKATARRQKPTTRVYEVERSQNVMLVLDAGRMMAGRVGNLTKLDYAVNAALMLAHVALEGGDRVGLLIVADEVQAYLPLGKGHAHFQQCLELLYGVQPRRTHVDYRAALEQIATRCKRRSLVVFFTDLVDEDTSAELVAYLRLLRPTHLPLCATLQDEHVVAAARAPVQTVQDMYQRTVALELQTERHHVLERLQRLGAAVLDTTPDQLSYQTVNRYLELKYRQLL